MRTLGQVAEGRQQRSIEFRCPCQIEGARHAVQDATPRDEAAPYHCRTRSPTRTMSSA